MADYIKMDYEAVEQLTEIMCDKYCKIPVMHMEMDYEVAAQLCDDCPLNKILEKMED